MEKKKIQTLLCGEKKKNICTSFLTHDLEITACTVKPFTMYDNKWVGKNIFVVLRFCE